ncbi:hypothetical protein GGX14DRAFT_566333 [Mycena pura]|uniref:Uncharacterized protein n=1 Tax=Mycena pura TaxID=153505 RepID=A0AAD6VGE8_9AGAR|nr:hypothetical protein GGX14DRAFT_566333 [Mycena pura]
MTALSSLPLQYSLIFIVACHLANPRNDPQQRPPGVRVYAARSSARHATCSERRPDPNGLVHTVLSGCSNYNLIRPDDIWLAILKQFFFNDNAERLRRALQGQGNAQCRPYGHQPDSSAWTFADMAREMVGPRLSKMIVASPSRFAWALLNFCSTTPRDTTHTLKSYFRVKYQSTMIDSARRDEADRDAPLSRLEKMKEYCMETIA